MLGKYLFGTPCHPLGRFLTVLSCKETANQKSKVRERTKGEKHHKSKSQHQDLLFRCFFVCREACGILVPNEGLNQDCELIPEMS